MTILYIAYGSNLHPGRLGARTPSSRLIATTELNGWQLHFNKRSNNDGSGKCNLIEGQGTAHVALFELSRADKKELDRIEGLGRGYDDAIIDVPGFGAASIYIAAETHVEPGLQPYSWYKALVLAGCRYHNFPDRYVREVEGVTEVLDADPERHTYHMSLLAGLDQWGQSQVPE